MEAIACQETLTLRFRSQILLKQPNHAIATLDDFDEFPQGLFSDLPLNAFLSALHERGKSKLVDRIWMAIPESSFRAWYSNVYLLQVFHDHVKSDDTEGQRLVCALPEWQPNYLQDPDADSER